MRIQKRIPPGAKLPADAVLIEEKGSWAFYYSESEAAVLVRTNDYHPGVLKITAAELRRLADIASMKR